MTESHRPENHISLALHYNVFEMFPCLVFYWVLFWSIVPVFCLPAFSSRVLCLHSHPRLSHDNSLVEPVTLCTYTPVFQSLLVVVYTSHCIGDMRFWFSLNTAAFRSLLLLLFSASLLQSSVSHDPSEIILICWFTTQETFLVIINAEDSCAAQYFCDNTDTMFCSIH